MLESCCISLKEIIKGNNVCRIDMMLQEYYLRLKLLCWCLIIPCSRSYKILVVELREDDIKATKMKDPPPCRCRGSMTTSRIIRRRSTMKMMIDQVYWLSLRDNKRFSYKIYCKYKNQIFHKKFPNLSLSYDMPLLQKNMI